MEFNYTIDPSASEPIMLIDKHIGMDSEDGEGIMGDKFTRELMFLDTLGKKSIQVWINSGGGTVQDGEQIFHAILKSKTPVDTHNTGTAASIAGVIFLAGRNRTMMDYSKLMMHPVSGGDQKLLLAFEQSVKTMLSSRSFLTEEQVGGLMANTSWVFHKEAETLGLCTNVEYSHGINVHELPENTTNSYKSYTKIVNKLINKYKPSMSKVTNKLKLNDSASEEAILEAIEAIENKHKNEVAENKSKFDKFVDELSEAKKAKEDSDNKYNTLKAKFDKTEEDNRTKEAAENKTKAEDLITNAVTNGRIVNEVEVVKDWTEQAISNFEKTKNMIEKLPINREKVSVKNVDKLPTGQAGDRNFENSEAPSIDATNTASYVALMNAKNQNKALNRIK